MAYRRRTDDIWNTRHHSPMPQYINSAVRTNSTSTVVWSRAMLVRSVTFVLSIAPLLIGLLEEQAQRRPSMDTYPAQHHSDSQASSGNMVRRNFLSHFISVTHRELAVAAAAAGTGHGWWIHLWRGDDAPHLVFQAISPPPLSRSFLTWGVRTEY